MGGAGVTLTEQQLSMVINQQLNNILSELNQSVTQFVNREKAGLQSCDDQYLLAVNRFYYQTFSDHFFPVFRQSLQEDIARLLNLAHDEASLSRDILVTIQRYARMYNQVKSIHTKLMATREESQLKILEVTRQRSQHLSDLLYPLKTLLDRIELFQSLLETIEEFMQDEELLRLAKIYPDHIILLEQVIALDLSHPSVIQGFNNLLSHLHHSCNTLKTLAENPWNQEDARHIIVQMVAITEKVLNRQAPPSLLAFYEAQFKRQYLMYTSLMEAGIDRNQTKQVREMARQFQAWLERLVVVLDRGVRFASRHGTELLHSAHYMTGISSTQIDRLLREVRDIRQDIHELVTDLSASQNVDTAYFLDRSGETVRKALTRLEPYKSSPALRLPPLAFHIERVFLELSFLTARIEMLTDKHTHSSQILDQHLQVYNMIQSYLDLLVNIRVDLERVLAPRNISRVWKNHEVRTERISLEKGHPFPDEYSFLLNQYNVETRLGDYEYPVVLYEEGDLFVIRVDQKVEYELPVLVIGRRE